MPENIRRELRNMGKQIALEIVLTVLLPYLLRGLDRLKHQLSDTRPGVA